MSKKKKIRICYPFVGDSIGGSHLSTIELIKKLDKSKFEIILDKFLFLIPVDPFLAAIKPRVTFL